MHERLQKIITDHDLTSARLAEKLGIQPSAVSHLLSGRNKPGFDLLGKIFTNFPDVNPRWLLLGEQPPYLSDNGSATRPPETISTLSAIPDTAAELSLDFTGDPPQPKKENIVSHKKNDSDAKVDKIIILYTDGTFETFDHK